MLTDTALRNIKPSAAGAVRRKTGRGPGLPIECEINLYSRML